MKVFKFLLGTLASLIMFAGCDQLGDILGSTTELKISKTSLEFKAEKSSQTIKITAPLAWHVSTDASWITVTPDRGDGSSEEIEVTVRVDENTGEERSADVIFSITDLVTKTLHVKQLAAGSTPDTPNPDTPVIPVEGDWGIVGEVNNWGNADEETGEVMPDIPMESVSEGMFAARNVELPEGGFKIRKNNEWNDEANLGLAVKGNVEVDHVYPLVCGGGSGDMLIAAGTYDIYLDETNMKVYIMTPGKDISEAQEPGQTPDQPDEPEIPTEPVDSSVWYLIGSFNNWAEADENYRMTAGDEYYSYTGLNVAADAELKLNVGVWAVNRGGELTEDNDSFLVDAVLNSAMPVYQGGANIVLPAGVYDVYLTNDTFTLYIMTAGNLPGETPETPDQPENPDQPTDPDQPENPGDATANWSVIGDFNSWNADVPMVSDASGKYFVAYGLKMSAGEFKLRQNATWDEGNGNIGLAAPGSVAAGYVYDVINGMESCNIQITVDGTYDLWLDFENLKLYVMTAGKDISEAAPGTPGEYEQVKPEIPANTSWYLVGSFNEWTLADENYKMVEEGDYFVYRNFVVDAEDLEFKLNIGDWSENRGGVFTAVDTSFALLSGGDNIALPKGTYDIYMTKDTWTAYVMTPGKTPAEIGSGSLENEDYTNGGTLEW